MVGEAGSEGAFVREALAKLGVRRFVLGVHTSAFPVADSGEWDAGYGAPLSSAGERLMRFAAGLGFDALQLGPAGQVSEINLSPYDGTVFARCTWSLGLAALTTEAFAELLEPSIFERLPQPPAARAARVEPMRVAHSLELVLDAAHARLGRLQREAPDHPLLHAFAEFRAQHAAWLPLNALYHVIAARAGDDPRSFEPALQSLFEPGPAGAQRRAALRSTLGAAMERWELGQFLCHAQHAAFRARARQHGLEVWGDMQVGFSHRDRFLHRDCFAPHWLLGAPPSRTNPHGQPWGYPLLDPDQLDRADSPARQLFALRVRKLLAEYDGVRIDHPHGLVCPWVYREGDPDPYHAVRHGARAYESAAAEAPELARWAIAGAADLDPEAHSHFADNWVMQLSAAQVERYARLFDVLANARDPGTPPRQLYAAEVLSTCPYPLRRVLERHGLGRFRVTQKADPNDASDPYRTEHAQPEDWLMLGTHDTPPVFALASSWIEQGSAQPRAAYLAERLIRDPGARRAAAEQFAASERTLLCASLADLFASRAEHVYIFVGDLFGEREPFNRAGIAHPDNWTARLPADFEHVYQERVHAGRALDIPAALRLALAREAQF